jgi:glycine dehydrogenase
MDTSPEFIKRHVGPTEEETKRMLEAVGATSLEELIDQTIPESIRLKEPPHLPEPITEAAWLDYIRGVAEKNVVAKSYIGMGWYPTITPPAIQRAILENPGWYTSYTPYQAEISQGRLEAMMNFQTATAELTGLPIANASLLDEATAVAEAMIMFYGKSKNKTAKKFFVDADVFPQTIATLESRAEPRGLELVVGNYRDAEFDDGYFGAFVQYPSGTGAINDHREFVERARAAKVFVCIAADLLSLAILTPPGKLGADAVVGSSQRFGVPPGFGGPSAAFFATTDAFKRNVPGRIIGLSKDSAGKPAYRMALQTREQHIRREKATSNICTAQALLASIAGMYAVYHGPEGLRAIAERTHSLARALDKGVRELGFEQLNDRYFDTLQIKTGDAPTRDAVLETAWNRGINLRKFEDDRVGVSMSEVDTPSDVAALLDVFADAVGKRVGKSADALLADADEVLRPEDRRDDDYMSQGVFRNFRSETELMRYAKRLENKDLSLTRTMIPLGSCTMKLNAASQLFSVTLPGIAGLHPYAPEEQWRGYREIIDELGAALAELTGLPGVSFMPNSGAQGEFAGLSLIRAYHRSRGEEARDVALIPASAHGTNPASAVMAGMKVVVVKTDENGNIDLDDLREKAEARKDTLAAAMITYPSTHGVFESNILDVTKIVHDNGGQVYLDGANMNAMTGLSSIAAIGGDVCHLNLHKTFAIPHGGGGPGEGPICCAEHLKPFLPTHPVVKTGGEQGVPAVAAAPFGSASILPISLGYVKTLGTPGLTRATQYAVLNANYIKAKLKNKYEVLYTGKNDRVAHELIFDMREFKRSANLEVEDFAKRLIDYGFHAPTVSFPVPGSLMVEPTESESLAELDRFVEAMSRIREEAREIEEGKADKEDNLLKRAPHIAETVIVGEWDRPYDKVRAVFPTDDARANKYWVPVGRIDNAYGDRNLVCSCDPTSAYEEIE